MKSPSYLVQVNSTVLFVCLAVKVISYFSSTSTGSSGSSGTSMGSSGFSSGSSGVSSGSSLTISLTFQGSMPPSFPNGTQPVITAIINKTIKKSLNLNFSPSYTQTYFFSTPSLFKSSNKSGLIFLTIKCFNKSGNEVVTIFLINSAIKLGSIMLIPSSIIISSGLADNVASLIYLIKGYSGVKSRKNLLRAIAA
ncbi:MAG TPA: hypothetical protein ENL45_00965 [Candidatus Woesearchaeota archaeon]|nr:hypothetical protein [Candidatus Woesearchaeota archaeon]